MNPFLQTLYGALGTLGFCFYFHVRKERFLAAALTAATAWAFYLLLEYAGAHVFLCSFGGSLLAAVLAEILARRQKAPSIVFYIAGIIPLVPGSALYYMMEAMVQSDYELAGNKAFSLIWTILGIGAGCALVIAAMDIFRNAQKQKT